MKSQFYFPLLFLLLFSACGQPPEQSTAAAQEELSAVLPDSVYLARGQAMAAATFATLSRNLQGAMQSGGVNEAVNYCKLAAYPLVDSLSEVHDARIRRTAERVRNPENAARPHEKEVLAAYQQTLAAGQTPTPRIIHLDEKTVGYYAPIMTMELCLKCHGTVGAEVAATDYELIQQLYPEDEAVGFAAGDLRGIWSIEMSTHSAAAYQ